MLKLQRSSVSQEKICVGRQKHFIFSPPGPCLFFLSFIVKRNWSVRGRKVNRIGWPFGRSPRSHTHALSWDVLITRYCMFIKPSHCYKQENAIVPSRKQSRNTGGPQTMDWGSFLHCKSVGQEKAHGCRVKIGVIIIWCIPPPCSSEPRCGPYWQWRMWRGEEAWIHQNILSFAFRTASSSLPLSLPLSHISRNWLKP